MFNKNIPQYLINPIVVYMANLINGNFVIIVHDNLCQIEPCHFVDV